MAGDGQICQIICHAGLIKQLCLCARCIVHDPRRGGFFAKKSAMHDLGFPRHTQAICAELHAVMTNKTIELPRLLRFTKIRIAA